MYKEREEWKTVGWDEIPITKQSPGGCGTDSIISYNFL